MTTLPPSPIRHFAIHGPGALGAETAAFRVELTAAGAIRRVRVRLDLPQGATVVGGAPTFVSRSRAPVWRFRIHFDRSVPDTCVRARALVSGARTAFTGRLCPHWLPVSDTTD